MKRIFSFLAVCLLGTVLCFGQTRDQILKVYNWADYIDEDLIGEFEQWYEQETGKKVKIVYQLFDINEVMLSKIELGHEDFDVVCPSDYIIERMLRNDLLLPIDRDFGSTPDYIGNISPYIVEKFNQIDGSGKNANDYSVGYMWGTAGILYNKKYVPAEEAMHWEVLRNPAYAGKIFMKDAFRDVYTSLLIAMNKDRIDSGELDIRTLTFDCSPENIQMVEDYLNSFRDNVSGWEADFGKERMTQEKAWINLTWSGDAQWAIEEAEDVGVELGYEVPREGSIVWFDGWVIPKYAKNVDAARYFINFMCKPENALRNMDVIGYVSTIGGQEILEAMSDPESYEAEDASYFFGEEGAAACLNPVMYPPAEVIARCGMMHDRGSEELLEMWSRVKGDSASWVTYLIIGIAVVAIVVILIARGNSKKHRHRRK